MPILKRDQILQVEDLPRQTVAVPEWGGDVCLRTLTGAEMLGLAGLPNDRFTAALLTKALCDDTGAPLFTDGEAEALMGKNHAVLSRLMAVAVEMNSLNPQVAEKNS